MSTHKSIDKICCVIHMFTLFLMKGENLGVEKVFAAMGYETKLFDTSKVHTIDIVMEDWEDFTANCKNEEYYVCSLLILPTVIKQGLFSP